MRIFAVSSLLGVASCTQAIPRDCDNPAGALATAKRYAKTHFWREIFQPNGSKLRYLVEEVGGNCKVNIYVADQMGGGLTVLVGKRDMKVLSALRTQ